MSNEEFLSRWSRRKRDAEISHKPLPPASVSSSRETEDARSAVESGIETADELDLSELPPLDSITAATDVTAFLRKGVPLALSREALRRAWLADPAIRDFVGLAENAWDFNDPNAMPGFGPLDYTPEQVRDLVARIVGSPERAVVEGDANSAASQLQQDAVNSADAESNESSDQETVSSATESVIDQSENELEHEGAGTTALPSSFTAIRDSEPDISSVVHRTHGSALPR
jgi:hypothetical protein